MVAQQCDLEPGELVWMGGDTHLYLNHADLITEQLTRVPAGAPRLTSRAAPRRSLTIGSRIFRSRATIRKGIFPRRLRFERAGHRKMHL
jgi:hypothetical protein